MSASSFFFQAEDGIRYSSFAAPSQLFGSVTLASFGTNWFATIWSRPHASANRTSGWTVAPSAALNMLRLAVITLMAYSNAFFIRPDFSPAAISDASRSEEHTSELQ